MEQLLAYRRDYEQLRQKLQEEVHPLTVPISPVAFVVAEEQAVQVLDEHGQPSRHTRAEALRLLAERLSLIDAALKGVELQVEKDAEPADEEPVAGELLEPWTAEDERLFNQQGRRIAHQPKSKSTLISEVQKPAPLPRRVELGRVVERQVEPQVPEDPADTLLDRQVRQSLFVRRRQELPE